MRYRASSMPRSMQSEQKEPLAKAKALMLTMLSFFSRRAAAAAASLRDNPSDPTSLLSLFVLSDSPGS